MNSYIRTNIIIAILFVLHSKQPFGVKDVAHNFEIYKEIVWTFSKFQNEYSIRPKTGEICFSWKTCIYLEKITYKIKRFSHSFMENQTRCRGE